MKTLDYYVGDVSKRRYANKEKRISTQFMGGDLQTENLSRKKELEDSVRMGGYEVSFRKTKTIRNETQQPMSGYSEFWLG